MRKKGKQANYGQAREPRQVRQASTYAQENEEGRRKGEGEKQYRNRIQARLKAGKLKG